MALGGSSPTADPVIRYVLAMSNRSWWLEQGRGPKDGICESRKGDRDTAAHRLAAPELASADGDDLAAQGCPTQHVREPEYLGEDERAGQPRLDVFAADQPINWQGDDLAGRDADGGIHDHDAGAGRDREQVVDLEQADDLEPDVWRQPLLDDGDHCRACTIVAAACGTADQDVDGDPFDHPGRSARRSFMQLGALR